MKTIWLDFWIERTSSAGILSSRYRSMSGSLKWKKKAPVGLGNARNLTSKPANKVPFVMPRMANALRTSSVLDPSSRMTPPDTVTWPGVPLWVTQRPSDTEANGPSG